MSTGETTPASAAKIDLEAHSISPEPGKEFDDIFIAVHGIGDQKRGATVRSVATRLAFSPTLYGAGQPGFAPQPLGYFHTDVDLAVKVRPLDEIPNLQGRLRTTGLAEIFWADIPQDVVQERRTLEETKAWARTVLARARFLFRKARDIAQSGGAVSGHPALIRPDFSLAAEVLEEIVDTVYVLENLAWLGEKAGLLKFDLRKVLEEYLGDVQIVTEFELFRYSILARFHRAMEQIEKAYPKARLHVVAHSEGTVVSFLGLLHAMGHRRFVPAGVSADVASSAKDANQKLEMQQVDKTPKWLKNVRGFLTIGSPIDKHLLLWDRLWKNIDLAQSRSSLQPGQIRWRNYYDLGDPIGYNLDTARDWLDLQKDAVFEFCDCDLCRHDVGYARSLLPGKAHNDYWEEPEVFEHYVRSAMEVKEEAAPSAPAPPNPATVTKVGSLFRGRMVSPALPYLLCVLLLLIATLIVHKAVDGFLNPDVDPLERYARFTIGGILENSESSRGAFLRNALCLAGLFGGMTVACCLPRLALGMRRWALLAFAFGAACYWGVSAPARHDMGVIFERVVPGSGTAGILLLALAVVLLVNWLSVRRPSRSGLAGADERRERWLFKGARPLVFCGMIAIGLVIGSQMYISHRLRHEPPEETEDIKKARILLEKDTGGTQAEREAAESIVRRYDWEKVRLSMMVPRPIWPVLLSGAAFLYLWWLSILIFDLAFVWHRYVRKGVALDRLRDWSKLGRSGGGQSEGKAMPHPPQAGEKVPCRNPLRASPAPSA